MLANDLLQCTREPFPGLLMMSSCGKTKSIGSFQAKGMPQCSSTMGSPALGHCKLNSPRFQPKGIALQVLLGMAEHQR